MATKKTTKKSTTPKAPKYSAPDTQKIAYNPRTTAELQKQAGAIYDPLYRNELTAVGDQYRQAEQGLSANLLKRGLGRSSYAGNMSANLGVKKAGDVADLANKRSSNIAGMVSQYSQADIDRGLNMRQYNNTLASQNAAALNQFNMGMYGSQMDYDMATRNLNMNREQFNRTMGFNREQFDYQKDQNKRTSGGGGSRGGGGSYRRTSGSSGGSSGGATKKTSNTNLAANQKKYDLWNLYAGKAVSGKGSNADAYSLMRGYY